jgi:hypothetical protein
LLAALHQAAKVPARALQQHSQQPWHTQQQRLLQQQARKAARRVLWLLLA